MCSIDDIEVCEKLVQVISDVSYDGEPTNVQEVYRDEAEIAYYYCNECDTDWTITAVQDQDATWALVAEHLNDN